MSRCTLGRRLDIRHIGLGLVVASSIGAGLGAQGSAQTGVPDNGQGAQGQNAPALAVVRCRVEGRVTSGTTPLPGASVVVHIGDALKAATSTDFDGKYLIVFAPNATYHLTADLTAFTRVERDVTLAGPPCDTTVDFQLTLRPRGESLNPAPVSAAPVTTPPAAAGNPSTPVQERSASAQAPVNAPAAAANQPAPPAAGARGDARRDRGGGQTAQRFQTLNVQTDAAGAAALDVSSAPDDTAQVARLLPSGFSMQNAQSDAVAISGNGDATNLDRGALTDRFQAIQLGQLDPATGQFTGANGQNPAFGGGPGAFGQGGGPAGRGGGAGGNGFILGGRGARGQNTYQGTTTYTFSGSSLNTAPYQLRSDAPDTQPPYAQNTVGMTFGGPLKIPGLYADTNRRTNFQVNYTGSHSNNVFDQYATVPTDAMRSGDFSASPIQLYNPATGQPFPGNQIPTSQMNPAALALLGFIPAPNLLGTGQNYHISTTALTTSDALSLRFTQNLSPNVTPPGARGAFGGGRGGFGGRGGPGGPGASRGTNIILSAQLQYRRNDTQSVNVFPGLGSESTNTSIAVPISLNIARGRTVNNFTVSFTHTKVEGTNAFSGVDNVAGDAGIDYPVQTDPFNWGVPNLSFANYRGLNGPGASVRTDNRITTSYVWSHPVAKHQLRIGGDYRFDTSSTESNANARGTFTFTGLYSSAGSPLVAQSGADFADFLLGAPQQATLQVGGVTHLHGHSFDAYLEDNWQKSAKLTFNLGLRYELVLPYTEVNGQMANLDAAPAFGSVAQVFPGGVGPYTGAFPAGLINADRNNIGPRVGFAYRMTPGTVLRGGYSITYNPGSYAAIARQLVAQPPFAATETVLPLTSAPLMLESALASSQLNNLGNYGVDKNYSLGQIQTWNATLTRNLTPVWSVVVAYTGVKGSDLDLLSAPNRGPDGLLIPTVQPFIWESSDGRSILNAGNFQLVRKLANGVSGSASYTLAKSMDDTPSLGAGGTIVAQNPQDLGAEWALSNFDRRQQFTGNFLVELPFGSDRRWLSNGGVFAGIVGGWSATMTLTAQTGTPLTARVLNAASNVAQGISGALRANYTGAPITVSDPSILQFFNTAAFSAPTDAFGDSGRNIITGPGGHQLNATLVRDIRLGGNRAVTLQVNATNLLNTVQWAVVDTNINSLTFGQITGVRPMRVVTVNARFRF